VVLRNWFLKLYSTWRCTSRFEGHR
jgi:hypothetical protein